MIRATVDFPKDLPCPMRRDYGLTHVSPFVRTPMDSGRSKQRRRFTSVPSTVPVVWQMTAIEGRLFEAWFRDQIHDGAGWFNVTLRSPMGYDKLICRFTEMYAGPHLIAVDHWRFSAVLEIFERPIMPAGWGLMPDYITHADIFDFAMNREWPGV